MNVIQGFIKIPEIANNTPQAVALFGELSPISTTFTRDMRNFVLPEKHPGIEFVSFRSVDIASEPITIQPVISGVCIAIGSWVHNQAKSKQIPVNSDKLTFIQALTAEFASVINSYGLPTPIKSVEIGEILPSQTPGVRYPDFVAFRIDDDTKQYSIKLWFSDSRFQLQYNNYEIVVLPPVGAIDSLNGTTAQVSTLLTSLSKSQIINQINAVTKDHPATTVYPIRLRWHNPVNVTSTLETEWLAVIYGKAGIDNDAVKDAIRTYISDNSSNTNWTSIYPDLYAESEFIIIPFWDQLSTPDNGYDEGLYRTAVNLENLKRLELQKIPVAYNTVTDFDDYKKHNLVIASSSYRALMFYSIGNPNNEKGIFSILQLYPDYMDISTSSPDFSRLMVKTQNFIIMLNEALHKAREYNENKGVPLGYSLSVKGNREYLGFDYEGFTYYVQTRLGYLKNN